MLSAQESAPLPPANTSGKRVWLITKQPLIADAITHYPTPHPIPLVITGEYSTSQSAAQKLAARTDLPDVVLVDFHRRCIDSVEELVHSANRLGIPTVAYSAEVRPYPVRRIVKSGVAGFVLKTDTAKQLLMTLHQARVGNFVAGSRHAADIASPERSCATLAPRVVETVRLLAIGRSRAQVAADLTPPVKPSTVSTYVQRAFGEYKRLGRAVDSTCALIHEARKDGYLDDSHLG